MFYPNQPLQSVGTRKPERCRQVRTIGMAAAKPKHIVGNHKTSSIANPLWIVGKIAVGKIVVDAKVLCRCHHRHHKKCRKKQSLSFHCQLYITPYCFPYNATMTNIFYLLFQKNTQQGNIRPIVYNVI